MILRKRVNVLGGASIVVLGLHLPLGSACAAGAAPKQLYNKTIEVQWSETTVNRRISDNQTVIPTGSFTRTIYVSNVGRVFARLVWQAGSSASYGGKSQSAPEDLTNRLSVSGNTMVLVERPNGAVNRRESVTFDSAFSGCSASVQVGKSSTSPHWTGFDGAEYELVEVKVQSATCAIRDGNPFAK